MLLVNLFDSLTFSRMNGLIKRLRRSGISCGHPGPEWWYHGSTSDGQLTAVSRSSRRYEPFCKLCCWFVYISSLCQNMLKCCAIGYRNRCDLKQGHVSIMPTCQIVSDSLQKPISLLISWGTSVDHLEIPSNVDQKMSEGVYTSVRK